MGEVQNVAGRPAVSFWSAGDDFGGEMQQQQQQQHQLTCKISRCKDALRSRRPRGTLGGLVSGALETHFFDRILVFVFVHRVQRVIL